MLKYLKQPDFIPRLIKAFRLLKSALDESPDEDWFYIFIQYIFEVRSDLEPEELKKLVEDNISASKGGELMTIAEKLRQEGRKKGRKEGGVEMVKENIIDVLEVKFGRVPSHIAEKIHSGDDLSFLKSLHKKSILINELHEIEEMLE